MHHEPQGSNGEGTLETKTPAELGYITVGGHTHKVEACAPYYIGDKLMDYRSAQGPCAICAAEGDAFEELVRLKGAHYVENRMHKLPVYRAYAQKWPFDMREMVLSSEVVFEEKDGVVWVEDAGEWSVLDKLMDDEAVNEMLEGLTPEEQQVIRMTSDGYKPREIAASKGDKDSARVRQDKYSALRKLNAPINENMRRSK